MLIWEARLIGESIDAVDPSQPAPTLRLGNGDGEADAAVHQPAWGALVKSMFPGSIELTCGGQGGVQTLAVLHSLFVGEAVVVTGKEHLAWKTTIMNKRRALT